MGEKRGTKALEVWCRRVTEGYPGVKVENMTTSWRDGLAFCALIHHFRPDLIDFDSLDKHDVYRNNELAFRIAERHLGIPALLDAEDMVEYEVPDRLSMLTYLSQFYQTFVGQQGHSPNSRTPVKRSSVSPSLSSSPDLSPSMSPTSASPPSKVSARGVSGGASSRSHDSCTHCGLPVFLAERLLVGTKRALYHRTCFRCARCSAQLTLANCYETEDGVFCCETCPDEEIDKSDTSSQGTGVDLADSKRGSVCSAELGQKLLNRQTSLSDDEKSSEAQLEGKSGTLISSDEYSALFESTLETFQRRKDSKQPGTGNAPLAILQQVPNDLKCKSDDSSQKNLQNSDVHINSDIGPTAQPLDQCDELSLCQSTKEGTKPPESEGTSSGIEKEHSDSITDAKFSVYNSDLSRDACVNQSLVSVSTEVSEVSNCTKDSEFSSADSSVSSIVKIRKMMFEGESKNASNFNSNSLRKLSPGSIEGERRKECNAHTKEAKEVKEVQGNSCTDTVKGECGDVGNEQNDKESSMPMVDQEATVDESKISTKEMNREEQQTTDMGDSSEVKFSKNVSGKETISDGSLSSVTKVRPSVSPRKSSLAPKQSEIVKMKTEDYPEELNPFGDEEEPEEDKEKLPVMAPESRQGSTNPFGSSDEEEPVVLRRKTSVKPLRPPPPLTNLQNSDSSHIQGSGESRPATIAMNPSVSPVPSQRRVIPAAASLNPFWSDGEEPEDDTDPTPVPLPRTIRLTPEPSPRPRTTVGPSSRMMSSSGKFGSSSSLSSMASNTNTNRRSKKPAPAPPSLSAPSSSPRSSLPPSPNPSMRSPHKRKSRPAPPPPTMSSIAVKSDESALKSSSLDGRKMQKDEANRTMQSVGKDEPALPRDKSTFGQWKRKKGPAPPRPVPQRRQVRAMPIKEVKRELDDIEIKQLELERQGVKLERTIRMKFDEAPSLNESSMTPDVEDLVIQLFELVNEKNELFRKQAELMYLRRQQRLEEEHAELEYQIRCLMEQPERNRTDIMKAREEELIQRLVEIVERRNEIIECLEMDRIREAEEDHSIHTRLGLFAAKNTMEDKESSQLKSKKEKKKKKESKKKKDLKVDADKDIDEVEAAAAVAAVKEKKSKRKWF